MGFNSAFKGLMQRLRSAPVCGWYAVQMPIDLLGVLAGFTLSFHTLVASLLTLYLETSIICQ